MTDFGDAAVLIPLSAVFFVWLLATRSAALAFLWLSILIVCNALMGVLKLYFLVCPYGAVLHSPSGHAGFSFLVYGALTAAVALGISTVWLRMTVIALGAWLVFAIAASRFMIQTHSLTEIFIGAAIGGAGLLVFVRAYERVRSRHGRFLPLALSVVLIALAFHGRRLGAEDYLQDFSAMLGLGTRICGFR